MWKNTKPLTSSLTRHKIYKPEYLFTCIHHTSSCRNETRASFTPRKTTSLIPQACCNSCLYTFFIWFWRHNFISALHKKYHFISAHWLMPSKFALNEHLAISQNGWWFQYVKCGYWCLVKFVNIYRHIFPTHSHCILLCWAVSRTQNVPCTWIRAE